MNEQPYTDSRTVLCFASSGDTSQTLENRTDTTGSETVQLDLSFDHNTSMLIVPEHVARTLRLPVVRHQALHEVIRMHSAVRKPVFAVELEIDDTIILLEAVTDSHAHHAVINPSLLRSLQLEYRRN